MEKEKVNIDFTLIQKALKQTVSEKAIKANSTIVYLLDGKLIKEDPKTKTKKILKKE